MNKGLEIGCGLNPVNIAGFEITHTDLVKNQYTDMALDAEEKFPFQNESFDLVIANNVLEHVKDFYFTVNEIHRVLKKGGVLKCSVPHFASSDAFREPSHRRFGHSRMFFAYTEKNSEKSMEALSGQKRFELVKFDYCMNFGKILKPIVNAIGFSGYEYRLARVLPFNIDMIFFELKKK